MKPDLSADRLAELLPDVEDPVQFLKTGLTADEAVDRREQDGCFNVVRPPIDCPAWACVLLPCIKHVPSMKAFAVVVPDDAEVLRGGRWIRYDAASLVRGDVIRMEEGDMVPADCAVVSTEGEEALVDLRNVTGEERLRTVAPDDGSSQATTLYYGGKVVQGSLVAVTTAVGDHTLLGKLIREKRFPPKEPILEASEVQMGNMA